VKDCDQALRITDGSDYSAYAVRGGAWRKQGRFELASADLNKAIERDPSLVEAYLERSFVFQAKKQFGRALSDLEEARRRLPAISAAVDAQRAWILATCTDGRFRDAKQAIELAQRVLNLAGEPPRQNGRLASIGTLLLAAAYAEAEEFDTAVAAQQRAIDLFRENAATRAWLESMLACYKSRKPHREGDDDWRADVMEARCLVPLITVWVSGQGGSRSR
jgi:tetratricopeptide (TPR) repeat protein